MKIQTAPLPSVIPGDIWRVATAASGGKSTGDFLRS